MRARNIKPGFFKNEELAECSTWARLMFPGLWMMADREGKLENRPKRIKAEIFPFDNVDVSALVYELEAHGLIKTYTIEGCAYIWIIKFCEHQRPHQNEVASVIPNYISTDEALATKVESACDQGAKHFALNPSPPSLTPESIKSPPPPVGGVEVSKPKRERIRFTPPTVSEVSEYVLSRQSTVDPDAFVAFYESKGWMIGKNRVKDWKACVRTWEANDKKRGVTKPAIDTSWHAYREWSTRYLTRRRAIHPDDTPEPTQDIVDSGARWLGEWVCPDGYTEGQLSAGISWLLAVPERCKHVKHLGELSTYAPSAGGFLHVWCVNGAMDMPVNDDPYAPPVLASLGA